jgi:hypothetical protein
MLHQIGEYKSVKKESCFFPHLLFIFYYLTQFCFSSVLHTMDTKHNDSVEIKTENNTKTKDLSVFKTCLCGIIMGFIAYSGSFSAVPITFTITALIFGTKSWITIFSAALAQLAAGYLHTHSSRTGIAVSTKIFHGFYIAKSDMRNRRQYNETRLQGLKRFFISSPLNALVINLMWETFTIYYLLHTELFMRYIHPATLHNKNETITPSSAKELESHRLLINGITRYLAGCLSGISTGLINQLWQRHLARQKIPHAIFNTDKDKLKLEWKDRKKLLSPFNMENWIKASVMFLGALFAIASNIPNITGFHLLDIRKKRMISDILVIHGGWFVVRDGAMFLLKKPEKAPKTPVTLGQSSITVEESTMLEDEQSKMLPDAV